MLIFEIKRIVSSEKWFNYVVTFFFLENARNLGRSDDAKRRKRGWPRNNKCKVLSVLGHTEQGGTWKIKLWNPLQFGRNHVQNLLSS